jgi:RNA polymerase sigma-70 factor (ECF subfamily)
MVPADRAQPVGPRAGGAAGARAATDAELARWIGGPLRDGDAEDELCRRFAPRIRLYGLKHLRDEDRARDLVQSVLLVVLECARLGKIDDLDRVDRFVLGTCRNLALQARRADGRARPTEHAELEVLSAAAASAMDADAVDVGAVVRCAEGLDARARAVLHLSFTREKSAEEIAGALQTTAGNVRVVRHRAVAQLRRCLDSERMAAP